MSKINMGRVYLGGVVGGLVANVIDFVVNGVLLADKWKAQAAMLNPKLDAMSSQAIAGYVVLDFALGILLVWLYAAIRPRFGAGPRTAMIATAFVWVFSTLIYGASFVGAGLYTWKLVGASCAGSILSMLAAANVGAMLYKE